MGIRDKARKTRELMEIHGLRQYMGLEIQSERGDVIGLVFEGREYNH